MAGIDARELAWQVLLAVEEKNAYVNIALDRALERFHPGRLDRAFATQLVYGVLRSRNTLDWALEHFLRGRTLAGQTPPVRIILRLGAYQLMFMDRVPAPAACNESARLARRHGRPGTAGFVNGVLRSLARGLKEIPFPAWEEDPVAHLTVVHSHPRWLVHRWLAELGPAQTRELCRADNTPAPNTIRVNSLKTSREELAVKLKQAGLTVEYTRYAPEGLITGGFPSLHDFPPFEQGLFQAQDEASMLAGRALSPVPGALVLDLAAAPGGKTTHLAQLMGNRGEIVACDLHRHKLKLIADNCRRLGVTCVRTLEADARQLGERFARRAGYVLLDAPCSGLGVLRRRPDIRWRRTEDEIKTLALLQKEMLAAAARCVKPGGVLVYSTCTISRAENQEQVAAFLAAHPDFAAADLTAWLPSGLDRQGTFKQGYIQLLPHLHDTDGFFIARLHRKMD
ncbi:16S rRNA (cytosine(967)-C(5))-methyltransferase [Desulfotomaculum copahuensis]|uniref:16S rRNA (cytosine(967)-C(5))-methyltransferase n=1 Tax=Desulfotomaculum copahuensis TaxID=1838280 RepID=A0A1B7LEE3_9FIRM|nr:16S rRNA (cytosine(967)-C(5))-methyltransferase RsmB [Desulfotomaculum copahuensis]OAT81461.1 16S rRNA (cytosine(967)-C(5))-methyltransferase [Desulfotomaculum copahuensis]